MVRPLGSNRTLTPLPNQPDDRSRLLRDLARIARREDAQSVGDFINYATGAIVRDCEDPVAGFDVYAFFDKFDGLRSSLLSVVEAGR